MHCLLRSADRTFFDGNATIVVARSPRGEFAIMDEHAPLLAALDRGAIRIEATDGTRVFFCEPGTARIANGTVHLLVETALPLDEIELSEIKAQIAQLDDGDDQVLAAERERLALLLDSKERYG